MDADAACTGTRLKEHLYRAEADRLLLQQKAAVLDGERQQLSADVHMLQQQLAAAHAAFVTTQQHNQQLASGNAQMQLQVEAAVREYRANDIICCGLRDTITRLQQVLADTQGTCRQQAQEISTFAAEMQDLRQCKADLTQQLSGLQQHHEQLQTNHASALKQLSDTELELQDSKKRWLDEHGDMARMVQDIQESKQQLQAVMEQQEKQLQDCKQQLKDQQARCAEFEAEVGSVRDFVMVLGKAIGKQPRGQELPSHEDAVWAKLGPLGGVQFALEVVIKHTRAQDAKVKAMSSELSRLEDRVRSESAQQADLQAGLYEVRGLYAKAISDRELLEARAARAEAERAGADTNWQRAKAQAADDSARLAELQEGVMSLTKQVQQLLPLQPRCSTLEVERDTAHHKLDRLQEQYDQLQRQQQQAVAREAELRASLDTYKNEHMQLLSANAQLLEKCQTLNKRVQVLEINTREGNLAVSQLEETKKRLCNTQTQLDAMSDSHARTLSRLETTKKLLHGAAGSSSEHSSGDTSPRSSSSKMASRNTSGVGAASDCAPLTGDQSAAAAAAEAAIGAAEATTTVLTSAASMLLSPRGACAVPCSPTATYEANISARADATGSISSAASVPGQLRQRTSGIGAANSSDSPLQSRRSESPSPYLDDEQAGLINEDELANMPPEVAQLLRRKGLEERLSSKQKKWQEMKVSMLSYFSHQLRKQLLQQKERSAQLELQLLEQEAQQLKLMQQQEDAASRQCMAAAAEASAALQQVLTDLRLVMSGEDLPGSDTAAAAAAAAAAGSSRGGAAESSIIAKVAAATTAADSNCAVSSASGTDVDSSTTSSSANSSVVHSAAATDGTPSSWVVGVTFSADGPGGKDAAGRSGWLHMTVSTMVGNLQSLAADAVARAELLAARQEVAVQSDDTQQMDWQRYVTSIPAGAITNQLHDKAVSEAIVRIYIRALQQLEASWLLDQQRRQGRPNSSRPVGSAGPDAAAVAAAAAAGSGGGGGTLFEAMMGHYSQQQQQQYGQQRAWQVCDASLWKDPQGPISRLLVSCQALAGSSSKVALFCRLVGTQRQPGRAAWGMQHWQHFLLVLHAAKRLIGGLWKGVLRDWASVAGARLPLQCVHDLLGNVYNVSYLAELDRLPAVLNTRQLLLEQPAGGTASAGDAAREQAQSPSSLQQPAEPGSGSSTSRSSREQGSRLQRGSVTAALRELLVDGPVGPAVDLDDLLAMIMQQFDAGLLPGNPLMEPRRLTDGSLANTNNALGQAALDLASSSSGAGQVSASSKLGAAERQAPDRADSSRSDWYLPSSMSGVSSAAGWLSRPTTGAAAAAGRVGMAAAGVPLPGESSSPAVPGMLPRIRTPDTAAPGGRPLSSGGPAGSLPAMASFSAALLDVGSSVSSSTAAGGPGSPVSRSPTSTASGSRVAFRDGPGGPASSTARSASSMKKTASGTTKGRMGQ